LCPRHLAAAKHQESDLSAALLAEKRDDAFHSAENINRSLSELFSLLAEDRISPRRAAVLAYIGSLLLRSLPAIKKELAPTPTERIPPKIIWDMPRPPHERTDPIPSDEELTPSS
jgi:hypothetical protein